MTEKLNPNAWALVDDEDLDAREGVQEVDPNMIFDYVTTTNELPAYSARPFAEWLNYNWHEFTDSSREGVLTNGDVIQGALVDWCGGRTH